MSAALLILFLLGAGHAAADLDCYGALVEVRVSIVEEGLQSDASFYGYPAGFGQELNASATPLAPLAAVAPDPAACAEEGLDPAPLSGAVGLVARGNCTFIQKARALQRAGYAAMLMYNVEAGCVFMGANASEAHNPELRIAAVSVGDEAGRRLLRLAAQGGALVTLREPAPSRLDLSELLLWAIAVGTLVAGALWAGADYAPRGPGSWSPASSSSGAAESPRRLHVDIGPRQAVLFVVLASCVLLFLFLFMNSWVALALVLLYTLGGWQATSLVLHSAIERLTARKWAMQYVRLRWLGTWPVTGVAAAAVAGAAAGVYAIFRNEPWVWPVQDGMSVCFMLVLLRQFHLPNLKVASILLPLAFVYDVWWVFLEPLVFGGNSVMVEVATGGASREQLPMVLRVPQSNSLGSNPSFSILGLGDVVLPGLLAVFARRVDLSSGLSLGRGYFLPCVLGFGSGLILTYLALFLSWFGDSGQPALLYLVPCTLGLVWVLAWARGDAASLWDYDLEGDKGGRAGAPAAGAAAGPGGAPDAEEGASLLSS